MLLIAALSAAAATKYGIVFDAGSSGSRIHVYSWKTGGGGPKDSFDLVDDALLKIKPGLSAYKEKPSEAGASLAPLLEFAKAKVPSGLVATTPVFLMATAGLRMVGEAAKDAILKSVCSQLSASGFLFRCEWATLLDGRDEGLYGWVTVNYLLDSLYAPPPQQPAGIIDLGGGSVQIVFPTPATGAAPTGYSQQLDFGSRKHNLYIKSHLGFGLDAARTAALDVLTARKEHALVGDGDWHKCKKLQRLLFDTSSCTHASCSFGGAYQPALPKNFYGFSYLYDRVAAIGLLDGKPAQYGSQVATIADIEKAGAALCALEQSKVAERFSSHPDAQKASNFCGDVAYLSTLLQSFGFSNTDTITMTNKIKGVELVWTLGAMLAKSAELAKGESSIAAFTTRGGFVVLVAIDCKALAHKSGVLKRALISGSSLRVGQHFVGCGLPIDTTDEVIDEPVLAEDGIRKTRPVNVWAADGRSAFQA